MKIKAAFMNLPSEITLDILSRLPIKTIASCKCVCRRWLHILSSPEFAELHLSTSSNPGLAVYQLEADTHICKIVEFQDELPEHEDHDLHYNLVTKFDPTSFISSPRSTFLRGSVDGFLCLHNIYDQFLDALYVCNPITREYIALPQLEGMLEYPDVSIYGFGVSSSSGEYKLVRINHGPIENGPNIKIPDFACYVYTLGTTGSWRSIEVGSGLCHYTLSSNGVFLNGNLHWLAQDETDRQLISRFDLETELFDRFSLPPSVEYFTFPVTLSVLWDCLCFCDSSDDDEIVVWVMKDYGVQKSWTKEIVISKAVGDLGGLTNHDCVLPLKVFRDGEILFSGEGFRLFYYSVKTETAPDVEVFKMNDFPSLEAMLHSSSFLSLKRFEGENVASF